jgi:hypothetical protein
MFPPIQLILLRKDLPAVDADKLFNLPVVLFMAAIFGKYYCGF